MKSIVVLLLICSVCSKLKDAIKYELVVITPADSYEKRIHNKTVITSQKYASSITVLSDISTLRKGMLQVTPGTHYFFVDKCNLESIEPGVFDDQNITEEIHLENNKLSTILPWTFKNLKITKLYLCHNRITHIEENAITNMPNLVELNLFDNQITHFYTNWIDNTPNLWVVILHQNNITKLEANMFSFMKKNQSVVVSLGENQLEEIDPKAFDEVTVWNLDLAQNNLKSIPEEIFSKNKLRLLFLNHNQLETLPEAFFEQKELTDVDLRENPLNCKVVEKLKQMEKKEAYLRMQYSNKNCYY